MTPKELIERINDGERNIIDADLQYADLRNANLQCANLQCANLRNANLRNANLQCADLQCADLCDVNLNDADLYNANLQRANLQGADLRYAKLWSTRGDFTLFSAGQHGAVAVAGVLRVGCQSHPYEWWIDNENRPTLQLLKLAEEEGYSEEEQIEYLVAIQWAIARQRRIENQLNHE